jgi:DNA (cytosine-5)-methyltransferase 1
MSQSENTRTDLLKHKAQAALCEALTHKSKKEIADLLGVTTRTVTRWENQEIMPSGAVLLALQNIRTSAAMQPHLIDFARSTPTEFTFIDLFAGIGGIRLGFEQINGRCIFTSEWNAFSQKTYKANHHMDHDIIGDIIPYPKENIPNHDVLLAGFPCQPFSLAGVSKKNSLGRAHGFECTTQGSLFFEIERTIEKKRPLAFLLENVKNLISHDQGRTFATIKYTLEERLGYQIHYKVIDGKHFTPQHRERIMIVGFREPVDFSWDNLNLPVANHTLSEILHPENGSELPEPEYTIGEEAMVNRKYVLSDKLWQYLQDYAQKHKEKGNGFGFGLVTPQDSSRTLSARYYKDGSEILISRGPRKNPRRLTPRECARLMGFPESFKIPVSDTQAYMQFGNTVVVPVIAEVARIMKPYILELKAREHSKTQQVVVSA